MTDDELFQLARDFVKVVPRGFRMRSSDARAVLKATGSTLTELIADNADLADKMQAFAFVELRKRIRDTQPNPVRGVYDYPDPAELWAMAEEMDVEIGGDEVPKPDPLNDSSF